MDGYGMIMGAGGGSSSGGKKAVHVKWSGKTIALGTFPHHEAEEKCARAKALTRAWRSTMRPKPSREWVMLELERLGVRVVSGRIGRQGSEQDDDAAGGNGGASAAGGGGAGGGGMSGNMMGMAGGMGNMGMGMMNPGMMGANSNSASGSAQHRPMAGGGSAAGYEAARADHYGKLDKSMGAGATGASGSASMGNDANSSGGGASSFGLSVNPNQHYEMLKLHHMNLLNEIQETTLMMNLYQQQQLQRQQQQQQQLQQQQNSSAIGGMGGVGGMGGNNMSGNMHMNPMAAMNSDMSASNSQSLSSGNPNEEIMDRPASRGDLSTSASVDSSTAAAANDKAEKLRKLQDEIKKQQLEVAQLEASLTDGDKRKSANDDETNDRKRTKTDNNAAV
mmetsp:Transcript_22782/g.51643  ORF Transcript_22782/g.51643 Transcript_22782/m.51643 type:complete len:392 (+) Transcript_22782:84-1259(+)